MAPVDQETVYFKSRNGTEQTIPALDHRRISERGFIKYSQPLMDSDTFPSAADEMQIFEEWKERMFYIVEDINWLLKLPHDLFWCQVIFDPSLHALLDSFLLYAPRHYDNALIKDYCQKIHGKVCKFMFLTIIRMSTDKESDDKCISPSVFGEILYDNYIFDVPKLLDICSILYGKDGRNIDILSKVISNVFEKQPKYYDDLYASLSTIFQTMDQISQKLGFQTESTLNEPVKLCNRSEGLSIEEMKDLALYLYDTSYTIHAFLASFPQAAEIFQKSDAFARFAFTFDSILPEIVDRLDDKNDQAWSLHCKQASKALLSVCHLILKHTFLSSGGMRAEEKSRSENWEGYIHTLSSTLSYKRFLYNYDKKFNIRSEFNLLTQNDACVDDTSMSFILDAAATARKAFGDYETFKKDESDNATTSTTVDLPEGISQEEIRKTVFRLKDLFPHLEEAYLQRAAQLYPGNEPLLINAILEGTLPTELKSAPKTAESVISTPNQASSSTGGASSYVAENAGAKHGVLARGGYYRKEFSTTDEDVMNILADNDQNDFVRDYVYNLEQKASKFDEYDDEYDDTYDSQNVGAIDADSADELDELTKRRAFVTPQILRTHSSQAGNAPEEFSGEGDTKGVPRNTSGKPMSSVNGRQASSREKHTSSNFTDRDKPQFQRHSGKSERSRVGDAKNNFDNDRDYNFKTQHGKSDDKRSGRQLEGKDPRQGKGAGYDRGKNESRENYRHKASRDGKNNVKRMERNLPVNSKYKDDSRYSDTPENHWNMRGEGEPKEEGNDRRDMDDSGSTSEDELSDNSSNRDRGASGASRGRGGRGGRGRGGNRGEASSRGRGRGKWHDKHHRKDKAAQKFSRGMGPLPRD